MSDRPPNPIEDADNLEPDDDLLPHIPSWVVVVLWVVAVASLPFLLDYAVSDGEGPPAAAGEVGAP